MAEKVGLIAILDMSQFNRSFASYTRALGQMNSQTSQAAGGMGSAFIGLGDSVNALAGKIAVGLVTALAAATAAMAAFVAKGISEAATLEQQLDGVNAILGNTEQQSLAVKDAVFQLGLNPNLKVTAAEAADAIELLARNGLSTNEILGETGDIMDSAAFAAILLANATGSDFGLAADIATDAMAVFNLRAEDMVEVVNDIVGVTNNSKFTIQDYSLALRNGGAAAADMGVSLTDFNTVIAASAEELGSGMRAGTGFRTFITRLTPNTNTATDAMRELGLITADGSNIFFDATGKLKDMSDITRILNQTLLQEKEVMAEVGGRTAEQNSLLSELQTGYDNASEKIRKYDIGLLGLNLSEEARNKKIEEQQNIMNHLLPQIQELTGIRGDLVTTTSKLTDEERSMALEAIFGADALGTVLALAKEGEPAFTNVADAMRELGVSQKEATRIVEEGITAYELLYDQIAGTDAVDQAKQRMDNFKGSLEILSGIFETVRLQIGDIFLPTLKELTDGLIKIADDVGPRIIGFFSDFFQSLLAGEEPILALFRGLREAEIPGDVIGKIITFAEKVKDVVITVKDFGISIGEFVTKHADVFIGALQGIGSLLAAASIAAKFIAIASAITALLNPVTALIAIAAAIGAAIKTDFAGAGTAFDNIVQSIQTGTFTWQTLWSNLATVVGNVWSMIEPHLIALWTSITTWFAGIDWAAVGSALWDKLLTAGGNLWAFVQPHLLTLYTNIQTWFITTDWAAIGQSLWDSLLTGGGNLVGLIIPYLQEIQTAILDWVRSLVESSGGDWNNFVATIITAWTTIKGVIDAFIAVVWPSIQMFVANLIEGFSGMSPILESFKQIWITLQPIVLAALAVIGAALLGIIGLVAGIIQGISQAIEPLIATFTLVMEGVLTFVNGVYQTLFAFVGLIVALFQGNTEKVKEQWQALGEGVTNIVTGFIQAIVSLVSGLTLTVLEFFGGLVDGVVTFFTNLYNTLVGSSIVPDLVNGIIQWFNSLVETGLQLITDFVTGIIQWFTDLISESITLVGDLVEQIITGLTFMLTELPGVLYNWYLEFINWVLDYDWKQLGLDIVEFIIKGLLNFINVVPGILAGWWNAFLNWFSTQDWGALAQKVIDGIIGGLLNGASAIGNAVSNLVSGITDRWNDDTESHSPSQLFRRKGAELVQGLVLGIEENLDDVHNVLRGILDIGSGISGFQSAIAKRFTEQIIDPLTDGEKALKQKQKDIADQGKSLNEDMLNLQDIIAENQGQGFFGGALTQTIGGLTQEQKDELKELKSMRDEALQTGNMSEANRFISMITRLQEIEARATTIRLPGIANLEDLNRLAMGLTPGASQTAISAAKRLRDLYREQTDNRNDMLLVEKDIAAQQEKIRIEQEKMAAIEKQQADLKFLQQQLDFLDFIAEHGLDAADVLGGLQLGLDTDLNALLQAMSGAMQQVIQAAEDELGIQSPSRVFERIAKLTWQGFSRGAEDQARQTAMTMKDITRGLVSSVTNGISNITNNNQRNRSLQLEVNNSFASQPQITDRSEMELLLASFV